MTNKPYTFLDLGHHALSQAPHPMTHRELWHYIIEQGLDAKVQTSGKTPWETLSARLYVDIRDNPESLFVGVGQRPVRFWLRSRALPAGWSADTLEPVEVEPTPRKRNGRASKPAYLERELHPVLAHFAFYGMDAVRVKTIFHESSNKRGFGEWVHPDLVGVRFPMTALRQQSTVDLSFAVQSTPVQFFAFELKRTLSFGNLRESFFQCVSNASWAHEAYLVAAEISDDEELNAELKRLSQAFGIGIIALDLEDPTASTIVLPATARDELDWTTLDKLVAMNPDVRHFVQAVRIDLGARHVHASEYDDVLEPEAAIEYAQRLGQVDSTAA